MAKSHKNERIIKLWKRGLTIKQISRKIGSPDDLERVRTAIGTFRCAFCGDQFEPDCSDDLFCCELCAEVSLSDSEEEE